MNIKPDKKKYNEFIKGLKITNILLNTSHFDVNRKNLSQQNNLEIEEKYRIKKRSKKKFSIECHYYINVTSEKGKVLDLVAIFEANYQTVIPIDEEIFGLFIKGNIQINVHPFLREYVSNITMRMGIPPIFIPFVKIFTHIK